MTTTEAPIVDELWNEIRDRIGHKRVMFGGSVPNLQTELRHSYHRSFQDSPHDGDYSVHYPGDAHPPVKVRTLAAALDVSFHNAEDIRRATAQLRKWVTSTNRNWTGAVHSPLLREMAGTLDSQNVFALDCTPYKRPFRTFGWDTSHLYHIHLSLNRYRLADRTILRIAEAFGDWN